MATGDKTIIASKDYVNNEITTRSYGNKNHIINGGFDIWQRNTFFSGIAGYTADRWAIVLGGDEVVRSATENGYRLKLTASSEVSSRIVQKIEGSRVRGRTITISVSINSVIGLSSVQVINSTGITTAGLLHTTPNVNERVSVTLDIPQDGDGAYTEVRFYANGLGAVYFSDIQLEEGSVATPFEQEFVGTTLTKCHRYLHPLAVKGTSLVKLGIGKCVTSALAEIPTAIKMRAAPSLIISDVAHFVAQGTSSNDEILSDFTITTSRSSSVNALLSVTTADADFALGNATTIRCVSTDAFAYLDAEIY